MRFGGTSLGSAKLFHIGRMTDDLFAGDNGQNRAANADELGSCIEAHNRRSSVSIEQRDDKKGT